MSEIEEYIEKMKNIQCNILEYIEDDVNIEENFQNLIKLFKDQNIRTNQHDIKSILYILCKIANNHRRNSLFSPK